MDGLKKTGKPKYYFSQSDKRYTIISIPDGYEVYKTANALVFMRRIQPKVIREEEIKLVKEAIGMYTKLSHSFVEATDKINVYTPNQDVDELDSNVFSFCFIKESFMTRCC